MTHAVNGRSRGARLRSGLPVLAAAFAALALFGAPAAGAPATGDVYVYRLINGFNSETVGRIRYEVERVGGGRVELAVTPDQSAAGWERTEVQTPDGNGLRQLIDSHGVKVEYEFAAPYPAYVFPLDSGKSWSVRVGARVPAADRIRNVRVDGRVLGRERIRVPAGEFDAIKVRRFVYAGDDEFPYSETSIMETDWYAPALGRSVRLERRSEFVDHSLCTEDMSCLDHLGDWDIVELVEARAARRP